MKITDKDIWKLNQIIAKLDGFKNDLLKVDYIRDKKSFFKIMREFRSYIPSVKDKKICDILIHSKYFNNYRKFFSERNMYYLRSLESIQSISIITKSSHLNNSFVDLMDTDLIRDCYERKWEEIRSLDFSKAKTLVSVWSGSMPETILYFYENTDIKNIIWLDTNHEAIFIAWEMINWLHLDKINLFQVELEEYDYKDADIVYIPLFIMNKNKILDRILETWKKDVQILVTAWKGLWLLIYEEFLAVNTRLKVVFREDSYTKYIAQEVIKLVKN